MSDLLITSADRVYDLLKNIFIGKVEVGRVEARVLKGCVEVNRLCHWIFRTVNGLRHGRDSRSLRFIVVRRDHIFVVHVINGDFTSLREFSGILQGSVTVGQWRSINAEVNLTIVWLNDPSLRRVLGVIGTCNHVNLISQISRWS
jgi:hypothetical protein